MSIEKRRFIRFSLDIPAFSRKYDGESREIMINQISIGGCLTSWDENIFTGDEFRLEFELPNKNRVPLLGKVIYRFEGTGIGVKFSEITQFEQELLAQVISERLESEGLPLLVDPFTQPPRFTERITAESNEKHRQEELVEQAIATEV